MAPEPSDPEGPDDDLETDETQSEDEPEELGPLITIRPRKAIALVIGLAALYFVSTFADIWYATRRSAENPASAAVVLGAAQYNGTPSPVLVRRLDEAAALYRDGTVSVIVVTGGQQEGDVTTEAKAGYDYLRDEGVPDGDLRLEVQGDSTYTSLAAAARFLRTDDGVTDVILVTDAYHTRRVELIAEEVGLTAEVSPVGNAEFSELLRETVAVSIGRVTSFRRLDVLKG